eukprot:CAMPEP_0115576420 /NCGR_PEP_ID=MMETSP0272-20121206/2546_1 /TAXON_ID=71861 /ORGANISM="Scrippsiella trochoidea, Strain CCMP3099" /LENGTH=71 /DNA_ID=CAMNT_0003011197 /DNA_START=123 /DNA_END=335 /DNA_ORIENTATION=+
MVPAAGGAVLTPTPSSGWASSSTQGPAFARRRHGDPASPWPGPWSACMPPTTVFLGTMNATAVCVTGTSER